MKASLTVLCLTTFLWAGSKPKTTATDILIFTNINVVNMRDGAIARDVTVVIRKGQISAVAKVGLVQQGHGVQIVNANGKYMVPGLWDMHVRVRVSGMG
jgi:adenine deaminase